jgi:hypothetical protein
LTPEDALGAAIPVPVKRILMALAQDAKKMATEVTENTGKKQKRLPVRSRRKRNQPH